MDKKIEATVFIQSKQGKSDELKKAIADLITETVKEPGCLIFKVFQNKVNPEEFILWEIFNNQSSMDAHMEKDYTKAYFSLNLVESSSATSHTEITP